MSFDTLLPPFNANDPNATFLSASCLDLLLVELVPFAFRMTADARKDAAAVATAASTAAATSPSNNTTSNSLSKSTAAGGGGGALSKQINAGEASTPQSQADISRSTTEQKLKIAETRDDEEREAVFFRLENLGYRVGVGLVERFSRDRARFTDTLDVIKFLCKDLWILCWMKHVDNLKTNHRGVYVLTDNTFRPLARMSAEKGSDPATRANTFLWYPCGILRGALAAMGVTASVTAETTGPPIAVFQITTGPQAAPKF